MNEMSSHERLKRMCEHREVDRVPISSTCVRRSDGFLGVEST